MPLSFPKEKARVLAEGRRAKFPCAQAVRSSLLLGTLSLRAPAAPGGLQYVHTGHEHVGLRAFAQAGHSMPEWCLVSGMIFLGAFVPHVSPV